MQDKMERWQRLEALIDMVAYFYEVGARERILDGSETELLEACTACAEDLIALKDEVRLVRKLCRLLARHYEEYWPAPACAFILRRVDRRRFGRFANEWGLVLLYGEDVEAVRPEILSFLQKTGQ